MGSVCIQQVIAVGCTGVGDGVLAVVGDGVLGVVGGGVGDGVGGKVG
jgi:hypothetical protein